MNMYGQCSSSQLRQVMCTLLTLRSDISASDRRGCCICGDLFGCLEQARGLLGYGGTHPTICEGVGEIFLLNNYSSSESVNAVTSSFWLLFWSFENSLILSLFNSKSSSHTLMGSFDSGSLDESSDDSLLSSTNS